MRKKVEKSLKAKIVQIERVVQGSGCFSLNSLCSLTVIPDTE